MIHQILLAQDFNAFPFGRYPSHGEWSGERFREEFLVPSIAAGQSVVVDLDGARGLSPSFLEEAFGGLVRRGFSARDVLDRVKIKSERDPSFVALIRDYVNAVR